MRNERINILFLSLLDFNSLEESNLYTDLLREFVINGHFVSIVSPVEKRNYRNQQDIIRVDYSLYKPIIGNIQKTNNIEKGISTINIERILLKKIKKIKTSFDLILYSTPPITFFKCVRYIRNRDQATSYLLLKDIFPQNAVDLNILKKKGMTSIIYWYFRKKEKNLYNISDYIGCMSEANKKYILEHNILEPSKVEVNPNSESDNFQKMENDKNSILDLFNIPKSKRIFIYGGNIGKPQGVDFIIECVLRIEKRNDVVFLIVGSGTEYEKLAITIATYGLRNTILLPQQKRKQYLQLLSVSDVGLIWLDHRFTIPNFPSRLLSYMKMKKPVLLAIDYVTDVGEICKSAGFGDYCYSDNVDLFTYLVDKFIFEYDLIKMGEKGYDFFVKNYLVKVSYEKIISKNRNSK